MSETREESGLFGIDVVIGPLQEDGTYTLQIANNDPQVFKESNIPREEMIAKWELPSGLKWARMK